jgi:hypothetical protein
MATPTLIGYPDVALLRQENLDSAVAGHAERIVALLQGHPGEIAQAAAVTDCVRRGYAPLGYGLADFTVTRTQGRFHLFHIPRVPGNECIHAANEHWFGHAVSDDLDTWVTKHPALSVESANYFESAHIWAPFVMEHDGTFYMYYTGLSQEPTQVLCMATSTDPELNIWKRHEGNPIIPLQGFFWHWRNRNGHLRQGRDPHVVRVGNHFLMAYTTMHANNCPAVGGLVSKNLTQWEDIGPILYQPLRPDGWMPESVNIQPLADGNWVLIPSFCPGLHYYISDDPHYWHGAEPFSIEYVGGKNNEPMGLEVLQRDDEKGEWLVAFFESGSNRFYLGVLHVDGAWRLERLDDRAQLQSWLRV